MICYRCGKRIKGRFRVKMGEEEIETYCKECFEVIQDRENKLWKYLKEELNGLILKSHLNKEILQ